MSAVENLLRTRAGLMLANSAYQEGVQHTLKAVNEAEESGVFIKPQSPYFAEWARMKREGGESDG